MLRQKCEAENCEQRVKRTGNRFCCRLHANSTLKMGIGHRPWNIGLKYEAPWMFGENNHQWKGDKAGYTSIHQWVYRHAGRPKKCSKCGVTAKERKLHWSNKSGEYKRDLNDWQELCIPCHKEYDLQLSGLSLKRFPELKGKRQYYERKSKQEKQIELLPRNNNKWEQFKHFWKLQFNKSR